MLSRLAQFNTENLFIFLDMWSGQSFTSLSEEEWQRCSASNVSNKPLYKIKALAEVIRQVNADIWMLNEIGGPESLANFNQHFLNGSFDCYLVEGNSDRGIDVGYLVKKDLNMKCVLISHKDRQLIYDNPLRVQAELGTSALYFSRDCAELRLFDLQTQSLQVVLLLVHLKSKLDQEGKDHLGRKKRAAEVRTLVKIYKEIRSEVGSELPVILGGDFNGLVTGPHPEPEFSPLFYETDLVDPFEEWMRPELERATQVQISPYSPRQLLQFDYILVPRNQLSQLNTDKSFVHRFTDDQGQPLPLPMTMEARSQLPSDHYPVTLTWKT